MELFKHLKRGGRTLTTPMSQTQKALWFDYVASGDSVAYHLPTAYRITGHLDVTALQHALNRVVDRQSALRTSLHDINGKLVQRIHPQVGVPIRVESGDPDMSDSAIQQYLHDSVQAPFDLSGAPLVRVSLLVLADSDSILVIDMHHIVTDLWSRRALLKQLSDEYNSTLETSGINKEPLTREFWEFCVDEQKRLDSPEHEKNIQYHVNQLTGYRPIDLPLTYTRPNKSSFAGQKEPFAISKDMQQQLTAFCREHRCTLYMVIASAYLVLLGRLSNSEDVAIGAPQSGRSPEYENHVGFFVTVAVLRASVNRDSSFLDVLTRVRELSLEIQSKPVPFETLVERLSPPRANSANPIFQHALAFQNVPGGSLKLNEVTAQALHIDPGTSIFDLMLYIYDEDGDLRGYAEYSTDLFSQQAICQFIASFQTVLQAVLSQPEQNIGDLPLLSPQKKQEMLLDWSGAADYAKDVSQTTVVDQILERVKNSPDVTAVHCGEVALSYADLWRRSQVYALLLAENNLQAGDLVGIYMQRSPDVIATIIAAWLLGAAYVPLDPKHPQAHTKYIVEKARLKICVTDSHNFERLRSVVEDSTCQPFEFSSERIAAVENSEIASIEINSRDRAYVIFTSGSTGQPKGVSVTHGNLDNLIRGMQEEPGCAQGDRLLALTTITFDISILELFLPLSVGATVVLATSEESGEPHKVDQLIQQHDITMLQATPSMWHALLRSGWAGSEKLCAISGGEALNSELAAALGEKVGVLWNLYGPTETTIWSTKKKIQSEQKQVVIGRPIRNTIVYALDENMTPLPPGIPGELYIGGQGVTDGYLYDEGRTQENFLPNPFRDNEIIYKTGDLVRFTERKDIEYLGRLDQQVKVRGFRIELGEIESKLSRHPNISRSAVCARKSAQSSTTDILIAYFEPKGVTPMVNELRKYLMDLLPDYMVPQQLVALPELPETNNGKINRKELSELQLAGTADNRSLPKTDAEKYLASVWETHLGKEQVCQSDNFFEIGGHSLMAVSVASQIEQETGCKLAIRNLVSQPLAEIAANELAGAVIDRPSNKLSRFFSLICKLFR